MNFVFSILIPQKHFRACKNQQKSRETFKTVFPEHRVLTAILPRINVQAENNELYDIKPEIAFVAYIS